MNDSTGAGVDLIKMNKLDSEQLNQIKEFIRKRGFRETDLQYEILDHMACKVEEKLHSRPELAFDEAVVQAHRDFGVFGFSTVQDAMRRSLEKQYWKQVVAEFRLWFRFPAFLLVGGFGVFLFQAFRVLPVVWLVATISVIYLVSCAFLLVSHRKEMKKHHYTLSLQAAIPFTVSVPVILLQLFVRLADAPALFAVVFALLVLMLVFSFQAARRVLRYAVSRCHEFEKHYGTVA